MIFPLLSFGAGWFKGPHEDIRLRIQGNDLSSSMDKLNILKNDLQTYVSGLTIQSDIDHWITYKSEIGHCITHLNNLINTPQEITRQRNKCLRILDGIETAT